MISWDGAKLHTYAGKATILWVVEDRRFLDFTVDELTQFGFIEREDVIDGTLVRVPSAYPAYFGAGKHVRDAL